MRKLAMKQVMNDKSNELVEGLLEMHPSMRFVMKIDDALRARGLTQAKLATLTGLRTGTISELVSGSRLALTKTHIACVMIALRITDIREIIDIEFDEETTQQFEEESRRWQEEGIVPESVQKLYADHSKALYNPSIL
jgi:transcriptional regulator with XRE-family HTH domain